METNEIINELKEIKMLTMIQAKEFLSVREVALLLDRSEHTIRKMAQQHLIGYSRPFGKEIYFRKSEINGILQNGYIPSITEIINN